MSTEAKRRNISAQEKVTISSNVTSLRGAGHTGATDAHGYPVGYFEATAGSFAHEPLEAPAELPMQSREPW